MKKKFVGWLILFCCLAPVAAQEKTDSAAQRSVKSLRVMFYNFENLFDPENDSLTNDEEFTPGGARYYTKTKMYQKINNIARVVLALGEGNLPAIVGACEIENRNVLDKLVRYSPLRNFHYGVVHYESPDPRGIDVGLLYRRDLFIPLYSRPIPVTFDSAGLQRTRDILYVKGTLPGGDTLHCFVNHWPSRYGGVQATIIRRRQAARVLKRVTDSICAARPGAMFVVMGDLNDDPDDPSVRDDLQARFLKEISTMAACDYVNLMWECMKPGAEGTLKHQNHWNVFDQLMVPAVMVNGESRWQVKEAAAKAFRGDFLFEPDETWGGRKLFRTYVGFKYTGGYSDHLPVYLDLIRRP